MSSGYKLITIELITFSNLVASLSRKMAPLNKLKI